MSATTFGIFSRRACALSIIVSATLVGHAASGQIVSGSLNFRSYDREIELLRANLRVEKNRVVRQSFQLPAEEAKAFWPLYEEYEKELNGLWDKRQELIVTYLENMNRLTDKDLEKLINRAFDLDEQAVKLKRSYFRKMKRAISAKTATRFFQIDRRINNLIEVQLSRDIPLQR